MSFKLPADDKRRIAMQIWYKNNSIYFELLLPVNISLDFSFRQKILTVQRADSANCFTEADYIIVV